MLRKIDHRNMGRSQLGWLNSWFHFSFAEYYNPDNLQFGALRVVNDDLIAPHTGFDTHPHADMEIVTYVVDGVLTHADSMGNKRTLQRGQVQYMSAGTGVLHSETNETDELLRLLQIWILPDRRGYAPQYGDVALPWETRANQWLLIASGEAAAAPVTLHQDMRIFAAEITEAGALSFSLAHDRQAYLVLIEGDAHIGDVSLTERDALEAVDEETLVIEATPTAHLLLFEMARA